MTTGLLIRDFVKEYREVRCENSGSIRLSEVEHNAYRIALTVEITHINAPRYENVKTLPNNTHYGYLTTFKGTSILDSQPVKFSKTRVVEVLNQGIWNYHQHSESLQVGTLVSSESAEFAARGILERVGDATDTAICVVWRFLDVLGEDFVDKFVYKVFGCDDPELPANGRELDKYRAFPVASPFPDVIKFKSDIPCSFLFRLEAWYLVNPLVYVVDNPTDTGDATEGEDEYPEPDTSGDFPEPSPSDADSDPRDSTGGNDSAIPFEGGQCAGVAYSVQIKTETDIAPPDKVVAYTVDGPVRGIRIESTTVSGNVVRNYFLRHGTPETEVALGGLFVTITEGNPPVTLPNNPNMSIISVSRVDGEPDNCGNPLPVLI